VAALLISPLAAVGVGVCVGACRLFVDTGDLTGGSRDGGVFTPEASAEAAAPPVPDAGGPDAATGPQAGVGLTRKGDATQDRVELSASGRFSVDFAKAKGWQADGWRDLATQADLLLTADRGLDNPFAIGVQNVDFFNPPASLTIVSESPAAVLLRTVGEGDHGGTRIRIGVDYTVFASGRIAVTAVATNIGANAVAAFTWFEYAHTHLRTDQAWVGSEAFAGQGYAFSLGGKSNLLVVNHGTDTTIERNNDQNRYWATAANVAVPWATNAAVRRNWERILWPPAMGAGDLSDIVADLRTPGLEVPSGGTAGRFDAGHGTYPVAATGGPLTLRFTGTQARVSPVFAVTNWTSPTFHLRRNGRELANTAVPIARDAVVSLDAAQKTLVIVDLEKIPANAPEAERTFVVEP
jgi:hypothetical protein